MTQFVKHMCLRPLEWTGLAVLACLVFVWPIRGTIALRQILILVGLVIWIWIWFKSSPSRTRLSALRQPLTWYCLLTAWLLVGAFLISIDTAWSLQELQSQWLKSGLCGLLGFLAANWAVRPQFDRHKAMLCLLVFVLPVLLQIIVTLVDTAWLWASQGYFPQRLARLTGGKLGVSYNLNFLFAVVAADLLARTRGSALLPMTTRGVLAVIAAALACTYVIGARNGLFCLLAIVVVALGIFVSEHKRPRDELKWIVVLLIVFASIAYFSFKSDYRWAAFQESTKLAWNTGEHRAWLDEKKYPLPRMPNGEKVDHSSYMRVAWIKEGGKALIDHPLGIGFGRNAMGRAFQEKYGVGEGAHSDNGLIDFAVGAGLPGVALGGAFLVSLALLGWRTYAGGASVGLVMLFVALGFLMRTLLDSTTRDNYLEQFLFMAAMFATLCAGTVGGSKET